MDAWRDECRAFLGDKSVGQRFWDIKTKNPEFKILESETFSTVIQLRF
jgi:hypothetical protein